jgi:formylglycine-generating enzyme required for sulfatase activity
MFVGEYLQTWRVAAHEFGHMMGLPDYYDYTFQSAGIGGWGIMGSGSAYQDARSKDKLGWSTPIDVSMDMYDVPFIPRSQNGPSYRLWHEGAYGPEYFLVELVTQTGYDQSLPGQGLIIWHVDDTQGSNNDENHKLLDVEEADGHDDLDHSANNGDATDPYWWPSADTFNSSTYPNSNRYSGAPTAVEVVNISTAQAMTADLLVGIISNLDVDEIEPNNAWDDVGVMDVPAPNSDPDGKLNYTDDLTDFWSVQVSQPSIIDVQVDSYQDTVNLNLTLWGPSGSGPIEVTSTTQSDEHLRACAAIPGTYYVEVNIQRGGTYYDLHISQEPLPEPGKIEIKGTPMLADTVYDDTMTMPAIMIEILNNAGAINMQSIQFYSQGDYPSQISSVELWLDNGDETFGPGLDTLIAGPVSVNSTNRFQRMPGLNLPVDPYTVIFAVIDIVDTGGGGNIGLSVESYKDIDFTNGMVIYPNFPLTSGIANVITAPMPLSYVAAGDFWMGSDPPNDPYYNPACDLNEETPAHWNRTGNYYIGRYEITNADYKQFMDDGGYSTQSWWAAGGWTWKNDNGLTQPGYWNDPDYRIGDAWGAYPVAGLSWYECMAYTNYIGGRLPRETEWEKAGRGTDGRIYTYGNVYNPSICALGWYPDPVGSYPASDSVYGLTDMCGNIFEWTYTSWAWGMYERYSEGILDEPGSYSYKMQRGYRYLVAGDCDQDYATRLSYRDTWPRTYRWSITGLRVAFDEP